MGELYRDNGSDATTHTPLPAKTQRAAVRVVAGRARDAADAAELLDALDLGGALAELGELRALGRGDDGGGDR